MTNNLTSRILYCDAHCVVVNKIAGEALEGAGKGMIDLPKLLAAELPDSSLPADEVLALPTAVHRLDVPVTGCAVFARTKTALSFLNDSFRNNIDNTIDKRYWAIVELPRDNNVKIPSQFTELIHWIQFDKKKNKSTAHDENGPGRKKAVLRYCIRGRGANYLFLEIELITGRHHQIRAQLERLCLCIKGDLKYGARRSEPGGGIRLHARSVSFPNPENNGKRITVEAAPPLRDNLWLAFEEMRNE